MFGSTKVRSMRDAQRCVSSARGSSMCNERDPNVKCRNPILNGLEHILGSFRLRIMQVRKHQGSEHAGCTTLRKLCAGFLIGNEWHPNVKCRNPILNCLGHIWGSFRLRKMQIRKQQGSEHAGCTTLHKLCAGFLIVQRKGPECQM